MLEIEVSSSTVHGGANLAHPTASGSPPAPTLGGLGPGKRKPGMEYHHGPKLELKKEKKL